MPEWGVSKVMGKRYSFDEISIKPKHSRYNTPYGRHLYSVAHSGAKMVALVVNEDLGLILQPPESG